MLDIWFSQSSLNYMQHYMQPIHAICHFSRCLPLIAGMPTKVRQRTPSRTPPNPLSARTSTLSAPPQLPSQTRFARSTYQLRQCFVVQDLQSQSPTSLPPSSSPAPLAALSVHTNTSLHTLPSTRVSTLMYWRSSTESRIDQYQQ